MKKITLIPMIVAIIIACGPSKESQELQKKAKSAFGTLPDKMPGSEKDTPELISLGEKLYFDNRLSVNDSQSCNSCHNVKDKKGGVDNLPTSPGAFGKTGDRNSPTVLNAGFHIAQFWDGRAATLADQAKGPILNPGEMAMPSEKAVIEKISKTEYPELFAKAFPEEKEKLTYDNLAKAIAAFERTLKTSDRFDEWVNGNFKAITPAEEKGLATFIEVGCTGCHYGAALGGTSFRKLGERNPYETKDLGRFNVTKNESEKYFFKVPSLRNVLLTAPYFHDGSITTIEDAVKKMGYHQLNKDLSDEEIKSIVAFLGTLTDKQRNK
ncbi:MAG: cytochrome-c peroxidase [Leptospiraceae bacterium]|nr:cytochrome-c peroxidase [Leptospiraceae bacterium]